MKQQHNNKMQKMQKMEMQLYQMKTNTIRCRRNME